MRWIACFTALALAACSDSALAPEAPSAPVIESAMEVPEVPATLPYDGMDKINPADYAPALAQRINVALGDGRYAATDVVRLYLAEGRSGTQITASSTFDRTDGSVMVFSQDNLPDDSVKAEQFLVIFEGSPAKPAAQTLAFIGARIKCYRGENKDTWTQELCP